MKMNVKIENMAYNFRWLKIVLHIRLKLIIDAKIAVSNNRIMNLQRPYWTMKVLNGCGCVSAGKIDQTASCS